MTFDEFDKGKKQAQSLWPTSHTRVLMTDLTHAVSHVHCCVCQKLAEYARRTINLSDNTLTFAVRCHGKEDSIVVTREALEVGLKLQLSAFRAEAEEIERLENEDAALAACGALLSDEERIRVEDKALAACGICID
jgi:hypothetical protein